MENFKLEAVGLCELKAVIRHYVPLCILLGIIVLFLSSQFDSLHVNYREFFRERVGRVRYEFLIVCCGISIYLFSS